MKKLLCALLTLIFLCGCTQQGAYVPTGNGLATEDTQVTEATDPIVDPTTQIFTLAYYQKEGTNPFLDISYVNRAVASLLYQGLFSVDRDYNVEPSLCKSYTVSQDMRTYTFYLEDATFSDGSTVTPADVLASLTCAKESGYYGGRFGFIGDMELTPDNGITIHLYTSMENLPILLDIPILKATQLAESFPDGTGPYRISGTNAGMSLHLRKNWWCSASLPVNAQSIPLVDCSSPIDVRDGFEFENVGLTVADPGSSAYVDYHCDYELWECETGLFLYIACRRTSEVFSNDAIRQALLRSINRELIVEEFYNGFARPTTLPVSPASPYYSQALANRIVYDPDALKNAVAQEGMTGAPVVLLVNGGDTIRLRTARNIVSLLTEAGLSVTLSSPKGYAFKDAIYYNSYDLYLGQTKLSPNMDLSGFFYTYGSLSYGAIDNPAAYSLCLNALENSGNYYDLCQISTKEALLCPILFRTYAVYAQRGLMSNLSPSRDNIFHYSLGKTMEQAKQ